MNIYEYQFGVYVEADNEQDAWEQVRAISEALDGIDVEGDSTTQGPDELTPTQVYEIEQRQRQGK